MATPVPTQQDILRELAECVQEQQELTAQQEDITTQLQSIIAKRRALTNISLANAQRIARLVASLGGPAAPASASAPAPTRTTRQATSKTSPQLDKHDYAMVVLLEDTNLWTEIWCHLCKGRVNARKETNDFYDGVGGLTKHYRHAHAGHLDPSMTSEKTVAVCGRRVLSKGDVGLIRRGQDPKVKIVLDWGDGFAHYRYCNHQKEPSGPHVPRTALNDEADDHSGNVGGDEGPAVEGDGERGTGEADGDLGEGGEGGDGENFSLVGGWHRSQKRPATQAGLSDGDTGEEVKRLTGNNLFGPTFGQNVRSRGLHSPDSSEEETLQTANPRRLASGS